MSLDNHLGITEPSVDLAGEEMPIADARTRRVRPLDIIGPVAILAALIGLWYWMHLYGLRNVFNRNPSIMPAPHVIIKESFISGRQQASSTFNPRSDMLWALWQTTKTTFVGLAFAVVLGTILAMVMTPARWLERSVYPYLVTIQAVPVLVIAPVIGVFFDYDFRARVLVVVIISIVPIVTNTLFGLRSVEQGQHDLFTLKRASWYQRLFKLQLPAALPAIFTGYRISAGLAVIGAIVGELFNRKTGVGILGINAGKGIGIVMDEYRSRNQYTFTYGALLLSSLLGIVIYFGFGALQKLVIGKWYQPTNT